MPYSPRYVISQLARGRPMPSGSPEPELHRAIATLCASGIDQAVHKGARMDIPDNQGRMSFHALLDHSFRGNGLAAHPERILACIRSLMRHRANPLLVDRRTGMSAMARMAPLMATPIGPTLVSLMRPIGNWNAPAGPNGTTVRQQWAEYAPPGLKERLLPPPSQGSRPSGP